MMNLYRVQDDNTMQIVNIPYPVDSDLFNLERKYHLNNGYSLSLEEAKLIKIEELQKQIERIKNF